MSELTIWALIDSILMRIGTVVQQAAVSQCRTPSRIRQRRNTASVAARNGAGDHASCTISG